MLNECITTYKFEIFTFSWWNVLVVHVVLLHLEYAYFLGWLTVIFLINFKLNHFTIWQTAFWNEDTMVTEPSFHQREIYENRCRIDPSLPPIRRKRFVITHLPMNSLCKMTGDSCIYHKSKEANIYHSTLGLINHEYVSIKDAAFKVNHMGFTCRWMLSRVSIQNAFL